MDKYFNGKIVKFKGKCTRCGRPSNNLEENVWLKPKMEYLCLNCTEKWRIIFKSLEGKSREEKRKVFAKFVPANFVFR